MTQQSVLTESNNNSSVIITTNSNSSILNGMFNDAKNEIFNQKKLIFGEK